MRSKIKKSIINILYFIYRIVRKPILWYQKKFNIKTRGVRVLVVFEDKIILVKHWYNNLYVVPGGGIKKTETPEQAAVREVFEETGIKIKQLDYLLGIYSNAKGGKNDTVYCYVVLLKKEPEIKKRFNLEIAHCVLCDISKLPHQTSPATKQRINEYKNNDISEDIRLWV